MKIINNKLRAFYLVAISGSLLLSACNKDLEQFAPIAKPVYPTGSGIAAALAANPNYSMYSALITRAGMTATLNDTTKTFTLFATDNNGMKIFVNAASQGAVPLNAPDATFLGFISGSLPAASAAGIVQYNTIGQKLLSGSISTAFPNFPYVTQIILDPNQPFVRMPIFPVRGTPYSYVNNLPLIATDMAAANGIIHTAFSIAAPPTRVLKDTINRTANLSIFSAAILRGDSGQVGLNRFDSLLNYGVTNMTVLAPTDTAFKTLINALSGGAVPLNAPTATFIGFLNNPLAVTAATVRGILAYHILASGTGTAVIPGIRVFSNNITAAPMFIKTLVNSSISVHPGVMAQATYTGPAVTTLKFSSYGTFPPAGTPFSYTATVVGMDRLAVNGVFHVIDKVLLPQ